MRFRNTQPRSLVIIIIIIGERRCVPVCRGSVLLIESNQGDPRIPCICYFVSRQYKITSNYSNHAKKRDMDIVRSRTG